MLPPLSPRWFPFKRGHLAALTTAVALALVCTAAAEPIAPERVRVVDGETIQIDGRGPHIRLVGFNAPESQPADALCARELALGRAASARLPAIVSSGDLDLKTVACACRPGTEGTRACNWGRACGELRAGGRNVGDVLVNEGLAVPFRCGKTSCPQLPRPWCSS
jgi:endonuclease YncB( thermonuclease family)